MTQSMTLRQHVAKNICIAQLSHPSGRALYPASSFSSRHQCADATANHRVLSLPAEPLGQLSILTLTNFDLFHLVQNIHTINDHTDNGVFACSQNASVKLCIWMK